jgi:DNA-binding NarL/FixJ family response regulator
MSSRMREPWKSATPIRVLIVDDHPASRMGVRAILQRDPSIEVLAETGDGEEAVAIARELAPDVVLMDLNLTGLTGTAATKLILSSNPRTSVLVLTSNERPAFARLLLDVGARGYLTKSSATSELPRAVKMVASGTIYVDPRLADQVLPPSSRGRELRRGRIQELSAREADVLKLAARGLSTKQIAEILALSPRTLETYKTRAMTKLGLATRVELTKYAVQSGWLD